MSHLQRKAAALSLSSRRPWQQWSILLASSVGFIYLFTLAGLPAALLLGAMVAAIFFGAKGSTIRVPKPLFNFSQAIVGCLIAQSLTTAILEMVVAHWGVFSSVIVAVIAASTWVGWQLTKRRVLPGNTALWGSSPGAATAMTLMAEAHGEDVRMVAFMQYLRVVFVTFAATLISRIWMPAGPNVSVVMAWWPQIAYTHFCTTLLIAGCALFILRYVSIPSGPLLLPMLMGALLHGLGWVELTIHPVLLAVCYMLIGWSIGLRFTPSALSHATKALPSLIAAIIATIALCGGIAYALTHALNIDPLTAYLATSPGGLDSVAIIATSAKADIPFIMALQTARFFVVLATGPSLAKFIAQRMPKYGCVKPQTRIRT